MHKILSYSFHHQKKRNISFELVNSLDNVDRFSVDCTTNETGVDDTKKLINLIKSNNYKYIIGIGVYSSKKNYIKIEKESKNKFRNNIIWENSPNQYFISEFIASNLPNVVMSTKMGNSWCNYTTYLIRHAIVKSKSNSLNGFIHIPNSSDHLEKSTIFVNKTLSILDMK